VAEPGGALVGSVGLRNTQPVHICYTSSILKVVVHLQFIVWSDPFLGCPVWSRAYNKKSILS
jgi:hypothetical protein